MPPRGVSTPSPIPRASLDRDIAYHSTYPLGRARVAYPWHPLHGRSFSIGQREIRDGADLLLVAERHGLLRELPAWMCDEATCAAMTLGPPMVCTAALSELAYVLASLAATRSVPLSTALPAALESPHKPPRTTAPEPTHLASCSRAGTGTGAPRSREADARAGAGRPPAVRTWAARVRRTDHTRDRDNGGWR